MVPVSLYDTLKIKTADHIKKIRVTSEHPSMPSEKKNLAYKAASLLLEHTGIHRGVSIHIEKRIPLGSGLGGGSSDAAAVLKGLSRLLDIKLARRQSVRLAAQIGADVPFFMSCKPAEVAGIGERVRTIPHFPRLWFIIIYPGFQIPTSLVYSAVRLTKGPRKATSNSFPARGAIDLSSLRNDLETVAKRWHPEIESTKRRLMRSGARAALMTGSGSSVFGVFSSPESARKAWRSFIKMPKENVFFVHSVHRWAVAKR